MHITRLASLTGLALCASVSATPAPFPTPIPASTPHSGKPVSAHLATQDPPPDSTLHFQRGPHTNKSAHLTLTTYKTTDCSTPDESSYQQNELTWNQRGTGWTLFYSYHLSRDLNAAEQLDFWSLPPYGGDTEDGGCGPHMETSSPDSNGNLLRGAEDPGPARPCYSFLKKDRTTTPVLAKGTAPGPSAYCWFLWQKLDGATY